MGFLQAIFESYWFKTLSAVFGIFGTIFGVWGYYQSVQTKELAHTRYSHTIFAAADHFEAEIKFPSGRTESGATLSETAIVIWNAGTTPLLASDVRVPLKISIGSNSSIVSLKIADVKSAVSNNFSLELIDDSPQQKEATINFKVFDPGMAVKVVLIHAGPANVPFVVGDFGPGWKISDADSRNAFIKGAFPLLLGVAMAFLMKAITNGVVDKLPSRLRLAGFIVTMIITVGAASVAFYYIRLILMATGAPISPSPS